MIDAYIVKHKKALVAKDKQKALEGFWMLKKGSDALYEVLGLDTIQDLPKLV